MNKKRCPACSRKSMVSQGKDVTFYYENTEERKMCFETFVCRACGYSTEEIKYDVKTGALSFLKVLFG